MKTEIEKIKCVVVCGVKYNREKIIQKVNALRRTRDQALQECRNAEIRRLRERLKLI